MAVTGPTLLDLQIITKSTTDEIAYIFTGRSVGGFLGGVSASVLVTYFNNWVSYSFERRIII